MNKKEEVMGEEVQIVKEAPILKDAKRATEVIKKKGSSFLQDSKRTAGNKELAVMNLSRAI